MAIKCDDNNYKCVIDNIKRFLVSDQLTIMERCYKAIRNTNENRIFDDLIQVEEANSFDENFSIVSIVILTANKFESDSVNYVFSTNENTLIKKRKLSLQIFENNNYCAVDAYIIRFDKSVILHLNARETGSNTTGGSTDIVRYISNNKLLNPNCIISFGVCYGRNPEKQKIGDVLVPKKIYPWSIGQKVTENDGNIELKIKNDRFNIDLEQSFTTSTLYNCINNYCNGIDGTIIEKNIKLIRLKQNVKSDCNFSVNIKMGNISTGEAVVSSKDLKDAIAESTNIQDELGGEMEGYGIAKECVYYAKIPCLIFKSICDWGELKNIDDVLKKKKADAPKHLKDKLQAYASFCAGILLVDFLKKYSNEILYLNFINWMGDKKRKNNICNNYKFASKETVIKNIKNFYNINNLQANSVFEKLLLEEFIIKTPNDNYKTTYNQENI